ncbi:MAG: deoxyguanosinetriphosphate triphosphohydrolase [Alphaproteobacteria bacterium]|nr:deoxyguanosinetriphosphate triphosphohydrolase [Alphaproteobacteria bacterium]
MPPDLAPFAVHPEHSRGRLHAEPESATRTLFQRDRDRVIHCGSFRRLKHKTQVFVSHEGDYYRTRLTHSLEVAQIGRSIARILRLNEDLIEALSLAHDLGHTPFGHAGEDALAQCMEGHGGFDHNAQALRIVTTLEERYAEFDGLNLTWESLEGLVKHNGPLIPAPLPPGRAGEGLHPVIAAYARRHDLWLHTQPSLEAQIAALSDDIAYTNHDIDDGLRAGLFSFGDLRALPLVGPVLAGLDQRYPGLDGRRLMNEMVRRVISLMVEDLIAETTRAIAREGVRTADEVRALPGPLAAFSPGLLAELGEVRAFLSENMYRHAKVLSKMSTAKRIVRALFDAYMEEPGILPAEWRRKLDAEGADVGTARVVCDFIAGMTDRYAIEAYNRLYRIESGF